jgi:superfamily II DNA helicase RecQ
MPFKFIIVPSTAPASAEQELNSFVRSHRVLAVDRRWVEQGMSSFWSFCIDYLDGAGASPSSNKTAGAKAKVDYKDVLKPDEFALYARLRELRKEMAATEAVPVYTLFTNEQLAQMVQSRAASKTDLEKIAGVGDARLEKYGPRFLEVLAQARKPGHETDRQST